MVCNELWCGWVIPWVASVMTLSIEWLIKKWINKSVDGVYGEVCVISRLVTLIVLYTTMLCHTTPPQCRYIPGQQCHKWAFCDTAVDLINPNGRTASPIWLVETTMIVTSPCTPLQSLHAKPAPITIHQCTPAQWFFDSGFNRQQNTLRGAWTRCCCYRWQQRQSIPHRIVVRAWCTCYHPSTRIPYTRNSVTNHTANTTHQYTTIYQLLWHITY